MEETNCAEGILIRRECRCAYGGELEYRLYMTPGRQIANYRLPLYSIAVIMRDEDGEESRSDIREVFANAECAGRFLDKLADNLATPIELIYIVEDELSR